MLLGESRRWRFAISQRHKRTFRRGTVGEDTKGSAPPYPPLGKWRIVTMALWDADFLDIREPAYITFD
jgi:hypothetical protein